MQQCIVSTPWTAVKPLKRGQSSQEIKVENVFAYEDDRKW